MDLNQYVEEAVEIMQDDDYSKDWKLRDLTGEVVRAAAAVLYPYANQYHYGESPKAHEIRAVAGRGWETFTDFQEIADEKHDRLVSDMIEAEVPNHLREKVRQVLGEKWVEKRIQEGWDVVVPSTNVQDSGVESIVAFRPM